MPLTLTQAVDAMSELFSDGVAALPQPPFVFWDDVEGDPPDVSGDWVRFQIRHNDAGQETMAEKGARKFGRNGIITVQVFTPVGDGRVRSDDLSQKIVDIFEGETAGSGEVWFRNVRANEIGRDRGWRQVNVLAEFEYDQVK